MYNWSVLLVRVTIRLESLSELTMKTLEVMKVWQPPGIEPSTAKTSWLFQPQRGYPAWLQTNWRDSGWLVVLKTNCIRQTKG